MVRVLRDEEDYFQSEVNTTIPSQAMPVIDFQSLVSTSQASEFPLASKTFE